MILAGLIFAYFGYRLFLLVADCCPWLSWLALLLFLVLLVPFRLLLSLPLVSPASFVAVDAAVASPVFAVSPYLSPPSCLSFASSSSRSRRFTGTLA